jgi:hypothetical protein
LSEVTEVNGLLVIEFLITMNTFVRQELKKVAQAIPAWNFIVHGKRVVFDQL